ncbi:protein GLUTAMINE DUMPER 5-like [Salvia hispanica]|uniref:protein GLUTAMINE DUMPER 5-like n=1 Tax=Salvia hispanica TaxID=49212 RepID=UPI002009671F|nr:protein GLUTAMINE DUMPER 5-like [Salvia hispanica]
MEANIQHPTTTTAAAADAGFQRWNSPIPYLFGAIALVMGVVALALLVLACSYKRSSSGEESSTQKSVKEAPALQPEMEPRIVVIMAGETNPTYLAKPIPARPHQQL